MKTVILIIAIVVGIVTIVVLNPFEKKETKKITAEQKDQYIAKSNQTLLWVGCGVSKFAFMHELAGAYFLKSGVKIEVEGGGATRGIRDTATLKSNLGGSCRHILPIDKEKNVTLVPVAWDALVVITNTKNPVHEMSLKQLKGVLTGKIRNWKVLGGPNRKINLVIREQGPGGKLSGVGMMTRELIFFNRDINYTKEATVVKSTGPLESKVEVDLWAVGITGISSAKRRKVKLLAIDGKIASYENIASGKYPLFRPLYLVLPKKAEAREAIEDFVAFALSDEGQAVVKKNGTVILEDGSGLWNSYRKKMFEAGVRMGDY